MEWLKGETDEYETDITDKRELQIRDAMGDILEQLPLALTKEEDICIISCTGIKVVAKDDQNVHKSQFLYCILQFRKNNAIIHTYRKRRQSA